MRSYIEKRHFWGTNEKCIHCGKGYHEKRVSNKTLSNGDREESEYVPYCPTCFKKVYMKNLKLKNRIALATLYKQLTPEELQDYKDGKMSQQKFDTLIRTRPQIKPDNDSFVKPEFLNDEKSVKTE